MHISPILHCPSVISLSHPFLTFMLVSIWAPNNLRTSYKLLNPQWNSFLICKTVIFFALNTSQPRFEDYIKIMGVKGFVNCKVLVEETFSIFLPNCQYMQKSSSLIITATSALHTIYKSLKNVYLVIKTINTLLHHSEVKKINIPIFCCKQT